MAVTVRVQTQSFDPGALTHQLTGQDSSCGAIASFIGQVRGGDDLVALELEHYPGVTETALGRIADAAVERWSLGEAMIVHRVGRMEIGEPIVFVAAAAPHRRAALEATGFMIDILKTQAPFWKREYTTTGSRWVEPRAGDDEAAAAWLAGSKELTA